MVVNGYPVYGSSEWVMGHPVYTRVTTFPLRSFKIFKQCFTTLLELARVLLG